MDIVRVRSTQRQAIRRPAVATVRAREHSGVREARLLERAFDCLLELLSDLQGAEYGGRQSTSAAALISHACERALALAGKIEHDLALLNVGIAIERNALLDVSFALRHAAKRVGKLQIALLDVEQHDDKAIARLTGACGVLRECLRQCIVLLSKALDPSLHASLILSDSTRSINSPPLKESVACLIFALKGAVQLPFPQSVVSIIEPLEIFRREVSPQLTAEECDALDSRENEIVAARGSVEFDIAARRAVAGLESLVTQVQLREDLTEEQSDRNTRALGVTPAPSTGRITRAVGASAAAAIVIASAVAFVVGSPSQTQLNPATEFGTSSSIVDDGASNGAPLSRKVRFDSDAKMLVANSFDTIKTGAMASPLTLQVGAFRGRTLASEVVSNLKACGLDATIKHAIKNGRAIYLVRIGTFADSSEARELGKRLMANGIVANVIVTKSS